MDIVHDEVLEEIHQIQKGHYEERKHLTAEEKIKLIGERTQKFIEECGYKLVPINISSSILQKS